jgi:hypothetical protein
MKTKPRFCEACLDLAERAAEVGEEWTDIELATDEQLVHDGVRLVVEHLCERHIGATIEVAMTHWEYKLRDMVIEFPYSIN